jgi:outer membrane lipoprotein LolB
VIWRAFLVGWVIVLGACSITPTQVYTDGGAAWQTRHELLQTLQDWMLAGRVVIYSQDEAWNADLHWKQQGDAYSLKFIAPLGAGTLDIQSVPGGVLLRQSDRAESTFAADPEQLLAREYGWPLPILSLRYWVKGITDPDKTSDQMQFDPQGKLLHLRQAGWDIRFKNYQVIGKYELPGKIFMQHKDLGVRMVIQSWKVGA